MNKCFVIAVLTLAFFVSCKNNNTEKNKIILSDSINSIEAITEKIRENPRNAELFLKRAELQLQQRNIDEAINDVKISLLLDSLNKESYLKLYDYNMIAKKSEDAKNALLKCISIFPNYDEARLQLAWLYFFVDMYIQAMQEINYIESNKQQTSNSYYLKGLIYEFTEYFNDALTAFRKSIEYDNDNWESQMRIGLILAGNGDKTSVDYLKTAVNKFPNNMEIRYNAGVVYQKFELYDEALEEYSYIIENRNNVTVSYNLKNYIYLSTAIPARVYEAYFNSGKIYLDNLKNYQTAVEYFTNAIGEYSSDNAYFSRGYAYELLKNFKEAETDYRKALEITPNYEPAIQGLNAIN